MVDEMSNTKTANRKRQVGSDLAPPPPALFVVATGQGSIKPDHETRKLIRRHVTKGKKTNRIVPRKRTVSSWINGDGPDSQHNHGVVDRQPAMGILEPRRLHLLHDFVPLMVQVTCPIERCVDSAAGSQHWYDDLARDPPYAQSVSEVASVFFDIGRCRNASLQVLVHMSSAIGQLRMALGEAELVVTDSMIFIVVALALVSQAFDEDNDSAVTHIRGLHQLIKLRGGVAALAGKRSLQVKCCR